MTSLFWVVIAVLAILQIVLPRRWAFLPLLIAACHLGPLHMFNGMSSYRFLIAIGVGRAFLTNALPRRQGASIDTALAIFSVVALISGFAHDSQDGNPFVFRVGLVLDIYGSFLYGRAYLPDLPAFRRFVSSFAIILLPLAIFLMVEILTGRNPYFFLGSGVQDAGMRLDRVRAFGPFRHPILTGTAGATSLPLMLWLSRERRVLGILGSLAAVTITLASASSGPLAALIVAIVALSLWKWRERLSPARWKFHARLFWMSIAGAMLAFTLYSGTGPWFILARVDLVGGSTGWHRAQLIDQALAHIDEWWLAGTDRTRHWMPTGVSWSPNHTDITNYYLHLGVIGGVGLTFGLMTFLWLSFRQLTGGLPTPGTKAGSAQYLLWAVGAALVTHAISFVSISYLGQMYALFFLVVGGIPGLVASVMQRKITHSKIIESVDERPEPAVA